MSSSSTPLSLDHLIERLRYPNASVFGVAAWGPAQAPQDPSADVRQSAVVIWDGEDLRADLVIKRASALSVISMRWYVSSTGTANLMRCVDSAGVLEPSVALRQFSTALGFDDRISFSRVPPVPRRSRSLKP